MRVLKLTDPDLAEDYPDMVKLAVLLDHRVVAVPTQLDCDGEIETREVFRWEADPFTRFITDGEPAPLDLNRFWVRWHQTKPRTVSVERVMKFYMQMGYSLSGFGEIFGQCEAADWGLEGAVAPRVGNYYSETPIDYVLRRNAGRLLKI